MEYIPFGTKVIIHLSQLPVEVLINSKYSFSHNILKLKNMNHVHYLVWPESVL